MVSLFFSFKVSAPFITKIFFNEKWNVPAAHFLPLLFPFCSKNEGKIKCLDHSRFPDGQTNEYGASGLAFFIRYRQTSPIQAPRLLFSTNLI